MLNLEPNVSEIAMNLVAAVDKEQLGKAATLIRNSALVVAEQGLYAFGLLLVSKQGDRPVAQSIHNAVKELLKRMSLAPSQQDTLLKMSYYHALVATWEGEDNSMALYRILLTQQVVEQMLNYATYYAKNPD